MTGFEPGRAEIGEGIRLEGRADEIVARYRSLLGTGLALLAACISIFLVWQTVSSLLIIFIGVLFATFLEAAARAIAPVLPVNRVWRLALVLLLLTAFSILGLIWGAARVPGQIHVLIDVMEKQLAVVEGHLLTFGIDLLGPEAGRDFARWFFDKERVLKHGQLVLGTAASFLTTTLFVLFLGSLFAFDPSSHRESVVMLVTPSYRARARAVLDEMGAVLRLWFVGQLIRTALLTLCLWPAFYLIGLPGPFVLAVQAGFSIFIPYLGPMLGVIPVALAAMPLGGSMFVWAVVVYTIIQSIEGHVIGPLIQRQAVAPPAWTLVAILLLGALFGIMGIALAMPLAAIGRVAVIRFYVEDYLGGYRGRPAEESQSNNGMKGFL